MAEVEAQPKVSGFSAAIAKILSHPTEPKPKIKRVKKEEPTEVNDVPSQLADMVIADTCANIDGSASSSRNIALKSTKRNVSRLLVGRLSSLMRLMNSDSPNGFS